MTTTGSLSRGRACYLTLLLTRTTLHAEKKGCQRVVTNPKPCGGKTPVTMETHKLTSISQKRRKNVHKCTMYPLFKKTATSFQQRALSKRPLLEN